MADWCAKGTGHPESIKNREFLDRLNINSLSKFQGKHCNLRPSVSDQTKQQLFVMKF
jgi:hypothetical protein